MIRKKSSRERDKARLDELFRPWVLHRAGHRCERCGMVGGAWKPGAKEPVVLQVAHFKSRRIDATRWHPLNVACLCKGCHFLWAHSEPDQFRNWWLERVGETGMELLNVLWKKPQSRDLEDVRRELRNLYLGAA